MENKNAKKNKFVDFIKENKGFQKLCVIILSIALIFILLLSSFSFTDSSKNSDSTVETYVNNLEKKLANALKKVDGVGEVSVVINVESGNETILAYNLTEKNQNGVIEREETPVVINGKTVVLKEKFPKIVGVLIVAEGSENISVRYKIEKATASLLEIDLKKIEILSMK